MPHAIPTEGRCPVISLASTKGGVGKTTLAYVLATEVTRRLAALHEAATPRFGRVTCIDADPNLTLSQVLRLTGDPMITCVESDGDR